MNHFVGISIKVILHDSYLHLSDARKGIWIEGVRVGGHGVNMSDNFSTCLVFWLMTYSTESFVIAEPEKCFHLGYNLVSIPSGFGQ